MSLLLGCVHRRLCMWHTFASWAVQSALQDVRPALVYRYDLKSKPPPGQVTTHAPARAGCSVCLFLTIREGDTASKLRLPLQTTIGATAMHMLGSMLQSLTEA